MEEVDIALRLRRVNENNYLIYRGRFVNTTFLLEISEQQYLITIQNGAVAVVREGPFVMPRWTFALRTTREAWDSFLSHRPPPGFHDIMALIKFKRLRLEGDQHPFIANLLYFKDLLAVMRKLDGEQ